MAYDIKDTFRYMLNNSRQTKAFYAVFFISSRVFPSESLPTLAGVSVTDTINLYYNPILMSRIPIEQQIAVIEHEFSHVIKMHCTAEKYKNLSKEDKALWNMAMDCEINQYLPDLMPLINNPPKLSELFEGLSNRFEPDQKLELVHPTTMTDKLGVKVDENRNSDFYYNLFKQNKEKLGNPGTNMDEHKFVDEEGTPMAADVVKSQLKRLKDGFESFYATAANTNATLKASMEELLEGKVNWQSELRKFHAFVDKSIKTLTRKKINRRYGLQCSGKRTSPDLKLAVVIDVSGSMSDKLIEVYSELRSMHGSCQNITVYEVDTQLQRKYEYDPNSQFEVVGLGGTLYNPGIEAAMQDEVDAILYIGDMDCYDNEQINDPGIPFMWVCMTEQAPPADFGFRVKVV